MTKGKARKNADRTCNWVIALRAAASFIMGACGPDLMLHARSMTISKEQDSENCKEKERSLGVEGEFSRRSGTWTSGTRDDAGL